MSDWRLVLAFDAPPENFGFTRAKSGKCWFRKIDGLRWAQELGRKLAALDIHGVIKKSDPPKAKRPKKPAPTREGFGGPLNATPIQGDWRRKKQRRA